MEPQPEPELEEFEDGAAELVVSRLSPRDVSDLRKSTRGAEIDVFERVVMLSTELREADEDEGSSAFTVYRMRCFTKDDRAWDIQKRFREFIGLRQQLIANGEAPVAKLKFPRRVLWGATDSKVVEKRMVGIQAWLNELLAVGMQSVRHSISVSVSVSVCVCGLSRLILAYFHARGLPVCTAWAAAPVEVF